MNILSIVANKNLIEFIRKFTQAPNHNYCALALKWKRLLFDTNCPQVAWLKLMYLFWLHYAECHHKHCNSLDPNILCVKDDIHHCFKVMNPSWHFHAQISALITNTGSNRALYWFVSQTVLCTFWTKTAVMFNVAKLVNVIDACLYPT